MIELKNNSPSGQFKILGCKPKEVLINETTYHRSLIVCAHSLIENWRPHSVEELLPKDWEPVIQLQPKIVLLGTGEHMLFPKAEILAPLIERNIGFEIMTTPAACRTYTILMAEDREVVAAIILG